MILSLVNLDKDARPPHHAEDQIPCRCLAQALLSLGGDMPEMQLVIPMCLLHHCVKPTVSAQVQLVPRICEISDCG